MMAEYGIKSAKTLASALTRLSSECHARLKREDSVLVPETNLYHVVGIEQITTAVRDPRAISTEIGKQRNKELHKKIYVNLGKEYLLVRSE